MDSIFYELRSRSPCTSGDNQLAALSLQSRCVLSTCGYLEVDKRREKGKLVISLISAF